MTDDTLLDSHQRGIERRQKELHGATAVLARSARRYFWWSSLATWLTVVLGALVATKETMIGLFPSVKDGLSVAYALSGVCIVAVAGLEAAFRFKEKSAKLHALAATCESTWRKTDTQWRKEVAPAYDHERTTAAGKLLDTQDEALGTVSAQAAELGISLAFELDPLFKSENRHAA